MVDKTTRPALLFVYGTLLSELSNRMRLPHLGQCLGLRHAAYVRGGLYDLGAYPGALPAEGGDERVFGEICEIRRPAWTWRLLDAYEDFTPHNETRSLFLRRLTTAWRLSDKRAHTCWIYWYNRSTRGRARIGSGNYIDYVRRRR